MATLDWKQEVLALAHPLDALDWTDAPQMRATTQQVLSALANNGALLDLMIRSLLSDPVRFARCERDNQIQLVLFDPPSSNYRLRLHLMPQAMADYPHGHRYPFGSLVLSGIMEQMIFAALDWGHEPIMRRPDILLNFTVRAGESYFLNPQAVHKVNIIAGPVVTLFARGPAQKNQASNFDPATGVHRWQRSATTGDSEGLHQPLSLEELLSAIATLEALKVIPRRYHY